MSTKAIFLDLDGTLLDDEKRISQENKAAIDAALQAGHKILICTGRPLISALREADALGLTGVGCYTVASNGSVIFDMHQRQVIDRTGMPRELTSCIFAEAQRRELHIQTYSDTTVIVEPRCENAVLHQYCDIIHMPYHVIPSVDALEQEPPKCVVLDTSPLLPSADFQRWIRTCCDGRLEAFYSTPILLEIMPTGQNKGAAVKKMAAILGIPMENTIAVGDAPNDTAMILAAGVGVCMANGHSEVKEAADYVTQCDNNHSGVAEVIRRFMLMC